MHTYELYTQNTLKVCTTEIRVRVRTIGTHRKILALLKFNFEVDSTLH